VAAGTVTYISLSTVTETQAITSVATETKTTTIQVPTTNIQSITVPVIQPQTTTVTTTSVLLNTEQSTDWPVAIILLVAGLLAGGLIVTIMVRKI
jgi:vacuolar-type H+-ATPase subunit D/Vma8